MALTSRRLQREEEEESVFVSMTDLMISILFIVMIVMAFFAKSAREIDPLVAELERQVITLQEENENLRAEIAQLQATLEARIDQEDRIDALRSDNRRLREELARIEIENEALRADIETLKLEKDELEVENEGLRAKIRDLEAKIKVLEAEVEELRKKLLADPLETALKGISDDRRILLSTIEDRLIAAGIKVIVDEVSGVIRFGEDAIQFASGSFTPDLNSGSTMRKISEILSDEMKCYTLGENSKISSTCNPNASIIEAVQIEGHTDADGSQLSNLELSTKRATSTYRVFITHRPGLESYLNSNYLLDDVRNVDVPGQQVLSVSGYGETRPVSQDATPAGKRSNRRIDIRFIMTTPKNVTEVEQLKSAVQEAVERQRGNE